MKTNLLLPGTSRNKTISKNNYPSRDITQTLTNGFFSVDKQWTVKYWNNAAAELLGVNSADIIGKNFWDKFAGAIPVEFHLIYQKAFLQDMPLHFEEYWGEMGEWFDVITYYCDQTLSVSFKSSNHKYDDYGKSSMQRLKTISELYQFVTEITNDCLWEWNLREEEIFWIDGGHKRIFGYQVENALIPQSFWESRMHPGDRERVINSLKESIAKGSDCLWQEEYRFARVDGTYAYVHDRGHIICLDGKASKMIGATQDISEKILLQKKLDEQILVNQREITAAVLAAHENERKEIGKELQENLNQVLATAGIYIQLAKGNEIKRHE
ncbi:MAG TPA: PAS domain-containing protein, partial [Puia sp.]